MKDLLKFWATAIGTGILIDSIEDDIVRKLRNYDADEKRREKAREARKEALETFLWGT